MTQPKNTFFALLAGLILGLAAYHGAVIVAGKTVVNRELFAEQQASIDLLREENHELTEELFLSQTPAGPVFSKDELPYDGEADASEMVSTAQKEARAERKFLMVTFGANWCTDCRTLHHHLSNEPVASYTRDLFRFAYVDVGKFNHNRDVAASLGVSLSRGIPVAVFFDRNGDVIGTTNEGQLEPSRHYSSKQILKFIRDVAERSRIGAPDSVD